MKLPTILVSATITLTTAFSPVVPVQQAAAQMTQGQRNYEMELIYARGHIKRIDEFARDEVCINSGLALGSLTPGRRGKPLPQFKNEIPYHHQIASNIRAVYALKKLEKVNPSDPRVRLYSGIARVHLLQVPRCFREYARLDNSIISHNFDDKARQDLLAYINSPQAKPKSKLRAYLYLGRLSLQQGNNLTAIRAYKNVLKPELSKYRTNNMVFTAHRDIGRAYYYLFQKGGGGIRMAPENIKQFIRGTVRPGTKTLTSEQLYKEAKWYLNESLKYMPGNRIAGSYLRNLNNQARMYPFYNP